MFEVCLLGSKFHDGQDHAYLVPLHKFNTQHSVGLKLVHNKSCYYYYFIITIIIIVVAIYCTFLSTDSRAMFGALLALSLTALDHYLYFTGDQTGLEGLSPCPVSRSYKVAEAGI